MEVTGSWETLRMMLAGASDLGTYSGSTTILCSALEASLEACCWGLLSIKVNSFTLVQLTE